MDILQEARQLITGDRREQYGPVEKGFEDAAAITELLLDPMEWELIQKERRILPTVIVKMLMATKLARQNVKHKRDNLVDLAGYTGLLAMLEEPAEAETVDIDPPETWNDQKFYWRFYPGDDNDRLLAPFSFAFRQARLRAEQGKKDIMLINAEATIKLFVAPNGGFASDLPIPGWVSNEGGTDFDGGREMIWQATFRIIPQAKQSTRFATKSGKVMSFTPAKKRSYQQQLAALALACRPHQPFEGPVKLEVMFFWPYPKSWPKKRHFVQPKDTKPDLDNCLKPLKDALRGIVYVDDSQIVYYETCGKWWGPEAKIEVKVEKIGGSNA